MRQRNRALHIKLLLGLGVLLAALSGCGSREAVTATGAEETASPANAAAGSVNILLRGDSAKIEGRGAEVEKGVLVIHEGGTYRLTGESRLPIEVRAANVSVTLIFAGEETNSIETDGREKKDGAAADPKGVDAAIFAEGNLTLRGSGSANIKAAKRGIVAKGELIVAEGIFDLRTEDDIFCGKESVTLQGGAVRASAQGDKGKGVSSDGAVILSGGSYVFAHTSEGIEGKTIEMSGGTSYINGSDTGKDAGCRARLEWQLPRGRRRPDCLGHEGAGGEDFDRVRTAFLRVGAEERASGERTDFRAAGRR
ncbi:hypothetical protein HMPREF9623_00845 [Stomatobaculum longum]|uniref:Carbohydrate-binding domain-containing protein n=1 Tax=Stomatobaculum longum TaxID=796942 RepID=A0AA37DGH6_9FIRM|nr:carbohydrate-binding domain-containing protein [Stomatobaculum longum]EHO17246.1 hypothetical protein HMPREF9623_00845 [Stomatobaculum longum]